MTDKDLELSAKYRKLLGTELANKIEFDLHFQLSDLSTVNGLYNLLKRNVDKVLTQDDINSIRSVITTLDFEGDKLNTIPKELIDKLYPLPEAFMIKKKKPYLRVVSCHD